MTTFEAGEFLKSEKDEIYVRLIQSDDPFPFPQHLLWPFASAVGGCLLIMLVRNAFLRILTESEITFSDFHDRKTRS